MKPYKNIVVCLLAVCFAFALTACNNSESDEFTSLQSFEYHFFPEEYEKEYSEHEKTITLQTDTDYQFKVDAAGYKLLFIKIPDPDFHNIPHMYYTVSIMKQSYHIILDGKKTAPLLFRFFTSLPASVHYERKGTPQSRAGPLLKNLILYQYFRNLRLTACHD